MKNRWWLLQKRLDCRIDYATDIVIACAVLHNFCIAAGDQWEEEDNQGLENDEFADLDTTEDGEEIRLAIADYL